MSPGSKVQGRSPWWCWTTDGPADVQPQAAALADRLGGVEGLQDVGGGGLEDAGAVVADLDQDPVAVAGGGRVSRPVLSMPAQRDAQRSAWAGWS